MRPLEIVLVAGLAATMVARLIGKRWPWELGRWPAGALVAVLVLHLLIEGPRRPMSVAYLVVAIGALLALRSPRPVPERRSVVAALGRWAVGLLLLLLAAAPPWLLPVFELPAPTGRFGVGSTSFPLLDPARTETLGARPGGPREFMVRVWYPAPKDADGPRAKYAEPPEVNGGILGLIRIGALMGDQLAYVKTHSLMDVPIAERAKPLPVLIFSHGYTGFTGQNTPQMEELASRGYVIFSISHTHDAGATVFPDGRVIPLDPSILTMFQRSQAGMDSVTAAIAKLGNAATPADRQAAFLAFADFNAPRIEASVSVWSADTRYLLDHLERLGPDGSGGRFAGALDLEKVGIFGMSFGGSNAGEVCRVDPRCKAGINIDGQQFGPLVERDSITVPFMIMASNTALPLHRAAFDRLLGPAFLVQLKGTEHLALTDTPLMAPLLLRWMGITGTMAPERTEALMTAYLTAFFDRFLLDRPAQLLTLTAPDPDVSFAFKNLAQSGAGAGSGERQ